MKGPEPSDVHPEFNLPGLSQIREAVGNSPLGQLPSQRTLRDDVVAGLNSAVGSAPDGMASGILAGVNPLYGLYASMVGPIVGGLFTSTGLMVINSTSAAALGANQALAVIPEDERPGALFLMVLIVGAMQLACGLLRLGRFIRFVSFSVMTGFLTGIAALMILSQSTTVTGIAASGDTKVAQTLNVLANFDQVDWPTLGVALLTLLLVVTLPRTRLGNYGSLAAIAVASLLVALAGLESVRIVSDVGDIGGGFPLPTLPPFSAMSPGILAGAFAVTVITLVQGAGVSQSVPNPDGERSSISRDFTAQGIANLASGFMQGLPVGGSLSGTALSVVAGGRTRWAAIFTGLWMAAFVLLFPALIGYVAMPALGALLIKAGADTIRPSEVSSIWSTGWPSRLAVATTFLATLFLPIQAAVGIGVALSALFHVYNSAADISLVRLVKEEDGRIRERRPPAALPSNEVTVLHIYGHLFFAGARTLERLLPDIGDAENPVVVLRLRGYSQIGATLIEVLTAYAEQLQKANGRLLLTGVSKEAYDQIVRTEKLQLDEPVHTYEQTPYLLESTREAVAEARTWLVSLKQGKQNGAEA